MQPDASTLEQQIRTGLAGDDFASYFQPRFDPDSDEIVGLEALLRWHHPELGLKAASYFMRTVELSPDLIEAVDAKVVRETTAQAQRWLSDGLSFGTLNVNISTWDHGDQLVDMISDALLQSHLPPSHLALECPWRMLAANQQSIAPTMRALRGLGCVIVLDGNPLSDDALDVVKRTPVGVSNVCIAHIQELVEEQGVRNLSVLIKKWHRAGVKIGVTGVEDKEQVDLIHKTGSRFSQGYRFKTPLPVEDMTSLLSMIQKTKRALSLL